MAQLLSRYIPARALHSWRPAQPSCWEPVHRAQPMWRGCGPQWQPFLPSQRLPFLSLLYRSKIHLNFSNCLGRCPILCGASTVLCCIENPTKPVDELKNCITVTSFKLPHKHGNSEGEYWLWDRKQCSASLMGRGWSMYRIQVEGKEIFLFAMLQAMISYIQTKTRYWYFSITKGLCELLNICMHTQLQTGNPG